MKYVCTLVASVTITAFTNLCPGSQGVSVAQAQAAASRTAKAGAGSMEEQVRAKEREGLDALKTGDLELFGRLTAEDAVMVDAQGAASKSQVLKNVGEFKLTAYSMDDVRFVAVSETIGLISYKITEQGVSHGHEFSAKAYVSSLWALREGRWVCVFSQETGTK